MLDNINKYLEATCQFLGIADERYGGGFRAIICHQANVDWLHNRLTGDDFEGTQTQAFFGKNPIFPACWGGTASEAIEKLDQKLGILYEFVPTPNGVYKWKCQPKFSIRAQYDCNPGNEIEYYEVSWDMVVEDLHDSFKKDPSWYYESAEDESGPTTYRNLHALLNAVIPDDFKALLDENR